MHVHLYGLVSCHSLRCPPFFLDEMMSVSSPPVDRITVLVKQINIIVNCISKHFQCYKKRPSIDWGTLLKFCRGFEG